MDLENDISDTPPTRQTTITLTKAAWQASINTLVSADVVRMINLLSVSSLESWRVDEDRVRQFI